MHRSILIEHAVPIVDEDFENGLELYCYSSPPSQPERFPYRGIVFGKDSDESVMIGVPYCTEYHDEEYADKIKPVDEYDIYESHEGTIIRVFYYKEKWYTSTHRKLDAFKSKWASPKTTFGQSFAKNMRNVFGKEETEQSDKEYLTSVYEEHFDKNRQYIFLLKPSEEERIVCDAVDKDAILHVATVIGGTVDYSSPFLDFPKPAKHENVETVGQLDSILFNISSKRLQGLLLIHKETGSHTKIYTKHYKMMFEVRNNVPSIKFRYMQLVSENDLNGMQKLRELYEKTVNFKRIHFNLHAACAHIRRLYVRRFVFHESFIVESALHFVLCRARVLYTKTGRPVDIETIRSIVTRCPTLINKVLKFYNKIIRETNPI